jgi:tetratricopeptide (TPR) repeat protein
MKIKRCSFAVLFSLLMAMTTGEASAYTYETVLISNHWVVKGREALRQARLSDAAEIYERALLQDISRRSRRLVHGDLCAVYYYQRSYEAALEHCDIAIGLAPNQWVNYNTRANVLLETGQFEKAIETYDRAILLRPNSGVLMRNREIALRRAHGQNIEIDPALSGVYRRAPDGLMDLNGVGFAGR